MRLENQRVLIETIVGEARNGWRCAGLTEVTCCVEFTNGWLIEKLLSCWESCLSAATVSSIGAGRRSLYDSMLNAVRTAEKSPAYIEKDDVNEISPAVVYKTHIDKQ